jgi:hypothetical protein
LRQYQPLFRQNFLPLLCPKKKRSSSALSPQKQERRRLMPARLALLRMPMQTKKRVHF